MNFFYDISVYQNIVEGIKKIIHYDVHFFNIDGKIIASSNNLKIGETSLSAKESIKNNKIVYTYNEEYSELENSNDNFMSYANIPIVLNDNIIGAIGITGNKDHLRQFSEIIKLMTQFLLKDIYTTQVQNNIKELYKNIIQTIMSENKISSFYVDSIKALYDIDLNKSWIPVCGIFNRRASKKSENPNPIDLSSLYLLIEDAIRSSQNNVLFITGNTMICLIDSSFKDLLPNMLDEIIKESENRLNINIRFGIGQKSENANQLKEQIEKARLTCEWNNQYVKQSYLYFQNIGFGILFGKISLSTKKEYLNMVFGSMTFKEITDTILLLDLYEKNNRSIEGCSNDLFVHKNTIQYRLTKIKKDTGLDPRNISDFFSLKIASVLYKSLTNQNKIEF